MASQRLAYKYRILPTQEQKHVLAQTFGCCRVVFNWALSLKSKMWREEKKSLSYNVLASQLTQLKKQPEYAFLKHVSSVPVQQTLRHLDRAFVNFFAQRARYPRYRKKGGYQSAEYTRSAFSLTVADEPTRCPNGRYKYRKVLKLARMRKPLYVVWHRPLPEGAKPSTVTITRTPNGQYYAAFFCTSEFTPLAKNEEAVGIDFGINSVVVTSDGQVYGNPRHFDKEKRKLARLQRKLAKAKQGGKNYEKARRKVAKKHAKIANRRANFQHNVTKYLIQHYQTVVVEDLNIKGMVKNRHLARAIHDVGWGEVVRQLTYKAAWYDRSLVKVGTFFPSSKTCSACKYVMEEMPLSVRAWACPQCGTSHDRDVNAARNILEEGVRLNGATERTSATVKASVASH